MQPVTPSINVSTILIACGLAGIAGLCVTFIALFYKRKLFNNTPATLKSFFSPENDKLPLDKIIYDSSGFTENLNHDPSTANIVAFPNLTITAIQPGTTRRTTLSESGPFIGSKGGPDRRQTLPAISLTPAKSPSKETSDELFAPPDIPTDSAQISLSRNLLEIAKRRFSTSTGITLDSPSNLDERRRSSVRSERFSILDISTDLPDEEDPGTVALNMYGLGKICFSVSYNQQSNVLYITVHKAAYLMGRKAKDSDSFFVKAQLFMKDDVEKHSCSTSVVSAKRKPIFEQTLPFDSVTLDQLEGAQFKLSVMKLSSNQERKRLVGYINFRLMSSYLTENCKILQDIWRDLEKDQSEKQEINGKIQLSLCYDDKKDVIFVRVISGKELDVEDDVFSVYVRVSLMTAERVLKVQKTRTVKDESRDPIFNEEFEYHVAKNLLSSLCLVAFVCTRTEQHYSHLIGKCIVGPVTYTDGTGLSHWTKMTANPNEAIECWHVI